MKPSRSELEALLKELFKFNSELDVSYNFMEFFNRCEACFDVAQQKELSFRFKVFEDRFLIHPLVAQKILFAVVVRGVGGRRVLKIISDDGCIEKVPLNITQLELGLRRIYVWCHKQLIKMGSEQNIDFKSVGGGKRGVLV